MKEKFTEDQIWNNIKRAITETVKVKSGKSIEENIPESKSKFLKTLGLKSDSSSEKGQKLKSLVDRQGTPLRKDGSN